MEYQTRTILFREIFEGKTIERVVMVDQIIPSSPLKIWRWLFSPKPQEIVRFLFTDGTYFEWVF